MPVLAPFAVLASLSYAGAVSKAQRWHACDACVVFLSQATTFTDDTEHIIVACSSFQVSWAVINKYGPGLDALRVL